MANVKLVLVANKLDAQEKRQVTTRQGTQVYCSLYMHPYNIYIDTSHTHTLHMNTHTLLHIILLYSLLKIMGLNFLKQVLILQKIFQRLAN